MGVDALSKGKGKGKKGSSGHGKGSKGQNNTSNVVCWNCGKSGHYEKDCRQKWTQDRVWSRDKGNSKSKESNGKSKGKKGKGKGKSNGKGKLHSVENWQEGWSETGAQGDEHAEGLTWSGEQAEGWWKATDDQNGSSSGRCHAGTFTCRALSRRDVDDGHRDDQDEFADQPEELRRVLAARQPTELERQKHTQTNRAVFAPWCEVCVKAKGTGAQNRRQTNEELAKQAQYGPRIYSDFFNMSEGGVSTPMLALKFSSSGRMAATALEQQGLTQYGVKFFAGFIGQTGVRILINKRDGEPAMKALNDAAAKAFESVESISQQSPVGDRQANGAVEWTVRTLKAQMRATRFALESRLGRQLAHDDPILTWIRTFAGDTIATFRKGPDGKTPWEREQGRQWAGDSLEFGERFFMKEAKERASGAVKRDWEPRLIEARYLGQHARTGAMIGITTDGLFVEVLGVDCPKQNVGIRQVGKISKECRETCDQQVCRNLRSMLRLVQAQPRQSEENERGKGHERDQNQSGRETKRTKEECERNESDSTSHLQHLHQRQMQLRTTASNPRELEGKTLEGENSM